MRATAPAPSRAPLPSDIRQAGFTLVEILVVLAVVGLIAAMIGQTLQRSAGLLAAAQREVAATARSESVRDLLRRQLEGAMPVHLPAGAGLAFASDGERLLFAGRRPNGSAAPGLYLFSLGREGPAGRAADGALVLGWRPFDPASPFDRQADATDRMVLLRGAGALRLSFLGRDAAGRPAWRNGWSDADRLPALIRIDLERGQDAAWRWPSLVVAPRLAPIAAAAS